MKTKLPNRPLIVHLNEITQRYEPRLGNAILMANVTRAQLQMLAKQIYLQERYPSHIAQVYLNLDAKGLDDTSLIRYIISIIRAENLGVGGHGITHAALAKRFALAVGVSTEDLLTAEPTPPNKVLMDWCDASALDRTWLDSLAVQVACESQIETMRSVARGLRRNYDLEPGALRFWQLHGGALERSHMNTGLAFLAKYTDATTIESLFYVYEITCQLLKTFYDSPLEPK